MWWMTAETEIIQLCEDAVAGQRFVMESIVVKKEKENFILAFKPYQCYRNVSFLTQK